MDILQDSNFWVLVSFLIFIGVFIKYGRGAFVGMLDDKIDTIRSELKQAETLRVDAQELLADYQRKHKDAMQEAEIILETARKQAEDIRLKAEEDAKRTAERREAQLKLKLERIEQNARQDIEAYTAKLAVNAARDILATNMTAKTDKMLVANTVDAMPEALD